jgi:hypothetical protein
VTKTVKAYKDCQSCGMPLRRDEKGGGTNADGSTNPMYCSHCFEAGRFTLPDISAQEMQIRVKGKLREAGIPGVAAWLLARKVPKLARWKQN